MFYIGRKKRDFLVNLYFYNLILIAERYVGLVELILLKILHVSIDWATIFKLFI